MAAKDNTLVCVRLDHYSDMRGHFFMVCSRDWMVGGFFMGSKICGPGRLWQD